MLRRLCAALLAFCLLVTPVLAAEPGDEPEAAPETELTDRERGWRGDLEYLRRHYKLYHKDPFYYLSETEFDFMIDQLIAKAGELSDLDMFFEIMTIIAKVKDIHTYVHPLEALYERMLPVGVSACGSKIYLSSYREGYEQFAPYLLGEVVAVGGVDITYLQRKAESIANPANVWYSQMNFAYGFLLLPAFLDWAGGPREEYTMTVLNENREAVTLEMPVISEEEYNSGAWIIPPALEDVPFLGGGRGNWTEYYETELGSFVYVSFTEMSSIRSLRDAPYQELFGSAAALAQAHPDCHKLVIDLRRHPGGYMDALPLVREQVSQLKLPSLDQVYVLTGGATTSAAIECIAIFKEELSAVTVGQPTGQFTSFFMFYNPLTIRLPRSQIVIDVANEWMDGTPLGEVLYDEQGKLYDWESTVLPDVFVSLDIDDIRQGKDSLIQWVLAQ